MKLPFAHWKGIPFARWKMNQIGRVFIAEIVDLDEQCHLLNSPYSFPNHLRGYVAPFGAIKFHDSPRARLQRLEIVYECVMTLFEPVNDVVKSAHGGPSRVWLRKNIAALNGNHKLCVEGAAAKVQHGDPRYRPLQPVGQGSAAT